MAACNIALITFLALKNTPLSFLTAYSYERLNCLHQMAGYCTVIFALLHGIVFTIALSYEGSLTDLLEDANIMGIVAGLSMLIILAGVLILRKRVYEVFYIMHVSLFMLMLIAVGMHRPDITLKTLFIIIFAASIWVSDRIVRFTRIIWHTLGNNASITPLARGGIRIVVRRSPRRAVPGSHVFLWIPKIRAAETHPFTIVSTNPLELVVSAHDGFTKDLFSHASKYPDAILRASIDGPYGTLPNFATFEQIILIAGGSGASFTFGIATDLVNTLRNSDKRPVVNFVWVMREQGNFRLPNDLS
jgi:predicted ferric reductase